MRKFFLLLMLIASMGMTGCGVPYMKQVEPLAISTNTSQDEATIVFFRPNKFWRGGSALEFAAIALVAPRFLGGGKVLVRVVEVEENGNPKYITHLTTDAKFLHKTTPGKHIYAVSDGGNFLEADLEAGKTYYAYVLASFGVLRQQFILVPATAADFSLEEFQKAFAKCDWYENNPEWDGSRFHGIDKRIIEQYSALKPEDKVLMLPEYGTDTPLQ